MRSMSSAVRETPFPPEQTPSGLSIHGKSVSPIFFPDALLHQLSAGLFLQLLDNVGEDVAVSAGVHVGFPRLLVEGNLEVRVLPAGL